MGTASIRMALKGLRSVGWFSKREPVIEEFKLPEFSTLEILNLNFPAIRLQGEKQTIPIYKITDEKIKSLKDGFVDISFTEGGGTVSFDSKPFDLNSPSETLCKMLPKEDYDYNVGACVVVILFSIELADAMAKDAALTRYFYQKAFDHAKDQTNKLLQLDPNKTLYGEYYVKFQTVQESYSFPKYELRFISKCRN